MLKAKFQSYPDGVVSIYKVADLAQPGDLPVEGLVLKQVLRYKERTVGLNRYYSAMQNNIKVDFVIRCPEVRGLSEKPTDILVAILIDGQQYRVMQIQYIEDANPPSMDLTLERLGEPYATG
jgi:hypothetical protein